MKKFLDYKVTVEESLERNEKLRPPAITICPSVGWVGTNRSPTLYGNFKMHCGNESTSDGFHACVENRTVGFNDLVISAFHGAEKVRDLSDFKFWTWDLSYPAQGRCYTLSYNIMFDIDMREDSLWITLNPKQQYYAILHEPDFSIINVNKFAIPTTAFWLYPATENSTQCQILTLEASRRTNLNRIEAPCNPSPNYNFTDCVIKYKAKSIGCSLPWNSKISGNSA